MAIIKDYKNIECMGQYDDVTVCIKKAQNRFLDGSIADVVTAIVFKDTEGNTLYKYEAYNNYICTLEDNDKYFSLNSVIEDLALYVSKCNIDKYYKNRTIENVLNNSFKGLYNIKVFKKEYYEQIDYNIKIEQGIKFETEINIIKEEIKSTIENIKTTCKELIRIHEPNKYNDYCYELFTKNTYKKIETIHIYNSAEGIEEYKNILRFFNEYLHYISIDYDPVEFLKFDKVV